MGQRARELDDLRILDGERVALMDLVLVVSRSTPEEPKVALRVVNEPAPGEVVHPRDPRSVEVHPQGGLDVCGELGDIVSSASVTRTYSLATWSDPPVELGGHVVERPVHDACAEARHRPRQCRPSSRRRRRAPGSRTCAVRPAVPDALLLVLGEHHHGAARPDACRGNGFSRLRHRRFEVIGQPAARRAECRPVSDAEGTQSDGRLMARRKRCARGRADRSGWSRSRSSLSRRTSWPERVRSLLDRCCLVAARGHRLGRRDHGCDHQARQHPPGGQ